MLQPALLLLLLPSLSSMSLKRTIDLLLPPSDCPPLPSPPLPCSSSSKGRTQIPQRRTKCSAQSNDYVPFPSFDAVLSGKAFFCLVNSSAQKVREGGGRVSSVCAQEEGGGGGSCLLGKRGGGGTPDFYLIWHRSACLL